jgi:SAM-dependent methyltransferase
MKDELKRYEMFGWDYDFFSPLGDTELNWYKRYSNITEGPILELACGTGRLVIELAKTGKSVMGMDLSAKMLEIANRNISTLAAETRNRITFIKGDITDFDLKQLFGLIIIADNSFREIKTYENQVSCLNAIHKHLTSKGKFLLTARNFDPSSYINGKRETAWSAMITDPASGNKVSRKISFVLNDDNKSLKGVYYYRIINAENKERIEECHFTSPVINKEDYFSLFEKVGFKAELFYDYNDQIKDTGQQMCFVCAK